MIELPEGVRITSLLESGQPETLRVGAPMELTISPLFEDESGNQVLGYKFKPLQ
jgi:uncharacterized OB-fold protein